MKIGRDAKRDVERVRVARNAIGPQAELYVDANGAYSRKQALAQAERFAPSMCAGLKSRYLQMISRVCV